MKPTDDEIFDFAVMYGGNHADTHRTIDAVMVGAKWVRDQQPKVKTLEDWVWYEQNKNTISVETPLVKYWVYHSIMNGKDKFTWNFQYLDDKVYIPKYCDSFDHGKQLAQVDYEKRVNELYL